ncbi:MAG TPA: HAD-IIB family hydrolase, partial [Candidatus Didemnitutus sp.]|nr:HAD-IIB family hydrolase [Candidatus Didemnitutus sp.]
MPSFQLFSADLDGTLLGNPESAQRFKKAWEALDRAARPALVYNSGRLIDDLRRFIADGTLPEAEYYIGGVGTQVYDVKAGRMMDELREHLANGWDLAKVREITGKFPGVRPQPDQFQHEFKSSWFLERAAPEHIRELKRQLAEAGVQVKVVYSSARDLDVLPRNATKGGALRWLCERLKVPFDAVLVAGDTANDASMFRLPGVRGIIVENALPELFEATVDLPTFNSRHILADGVLDGLCHYGIVCVLPTKETTRQKRADMAPGFQMLFTGTKLGTLNDKEKSFLNVAYEKA